MRENKRKRIRSLATFMDEMDADVIYLGLEMGELIECRFLLAPVVSRPAEVFLGGTRNPGEI